MSGIMDELRQAMAEFDAATRATRTASAPRAAARVLKLVRQLLAEVDGVRQAGGLQYHVEVEPLGPPDPAGAELPPGVGPVTCILTGAPGENEDDCTTHAHDA